MRRSDRATVAVVFFATLVGLGIRLAIVTASTFPLNDGGLFYTMIMDLVSNRLALPVISSYNSVAMPFAYPPLGLYFYAILSLATRLPLLKLVQFGPAIVSAASIPAFFLLANAMLRSKPQAAVASIIFALVPRAFDWLIMGGGVTRSFGLLFALLAMHQAFLLFTARSRKSFVLLILFGSLVVYSHPEAATHTALTAVLFYLWHDRSRKGFIAALLVGAGILILTAPWWALVVARHGIAPFLAAAAAAKEDSYSVLVGLFDLFRFDFADEPFITVLSGLGLLGIAVQLARRDFLLPAWLLSMHVLEPRGGPLFMTIPLAMCAGIALEGVILPAVRPDGKSVAGTPNTLSGETSTWLEDALRGSAAQLVVGFVIVYAMMSAYATGWRILQDFTLGTPDTRAMAWVRNNTPVDTPFAIVTGALPLRDAASEWFPTLTGRTSIATVFGYEWIRGVDFGGRVELYRSLQSCAAQEAECLQAWARGHEITYEYVYLRVPPGGHTVPLGVSLEESSQYQNVYASDGVTIYHWNAPALTWSGARASH